MAINSCTLCMHVSFFQLFCIHILHVSLIDISNFICYSGFDEIMQPNRIKAVLGLHKISEYRESRKNLSSLNYSDGAYEIEFRNIVVHPEYSCKKPYNDIGKKFYINNN